MRAAGIVLLALIVLPVCFAALLLVRLAAGPTDLDWLAHRFLPRRLAGGAELRVAHVSAMLELRGTDAPLLRLRLGGLAVQPAGAGEPDRVREATVAVSLPPLLLGRVRVRDAALDDATLFLRRDENGVSLAAEPPRPPAPHPARSRPGAVLADWRGLRSLDATNLSVQVEDRVLHAEWGIERATARLRTVPGGVAGRIGATLRVDADRAVLSAAGDVEPGTGPVWQVESSVLPPTMMATVLPAFRAMPVPLTPKLTLRFRDDPTRFMDLDGADLALTLGSGTVAAGASVLGLREGSVAATLSLPGGLTGPGPHPAHLHLTEARLALRAAGPAAVVPAAAGLPAPNPPNTGPVLPDPVFDLRGTLELDAVAAPRRIRAALSAVATPIDFRTLAAFWPEGVAKGARRWILRNITGGTATGLRVATSLASDSGWGALRETARSGGFDAHDLTLWWLRPIPPLQQMDARLDFNGPDAVRIATPGAVMPVEPNGVLHRPGRLQVGPSSMDITGLNAHEQIGTLALRITGALPVLLGELAHPRLHLLSRHPLPFTDPAGQVDSRFTLSLPLDADVSTDEIRLQVHDRLRDVHLGDVFAHRALDRGDLLLEATGDGLTLFGTAVVAHVPATLRYEMDFRSGPADGITDHATVSGHLTPAILRAEGLDPKQALSGSAGLKADYTARRDGEARVSLALDLRDLGVRTAVWTKPEGAAATASGSISLLHGRLRAIDDLRAEGPDLSVHARAEVRNGTAERVVVGRFRIGRTEGSGSIAVPAADRPSAPIRVTAHGPSLDLSALTANTGAGGASDRVRERRGGDVGLVPWSADLGFERVWVRRDRFLSGVRAVLDDDGRHIARARVEASAPTAVSLRLDPVRGGRTVSGTVADTGTLLSALGVTSQFSGGRLALSGRFDDRVAGSPLAGRVMVGPFSMPDAPRLARLVRDASIYGLLSAPPAPELRLDRLVVPFTFVDGVVTLRDARVHQAALGATAQGTIDLDRDTIALQGTLVPAWAINQLPGRLPLLGRLFSPEKGGGLLAATFRLDGPLGDPKLSVNPWALLLPGALRRLLGG